MKTQSERIKNRIAWDTIRLHETLSKAYNNTKFYKNIWSQAGVSPLDFRDRHSLQKFPVICKADVAVAPLDLVSSIDLPNNIRDTSGTTGVRLPIYTSKKCDDSMAQLRSGRSKDHPSPKLVFRILPPPRRLMPHSPGNADTNIGSIVMHLQPASGSSVWYDTVDMAIDVLLGEYFVGSDLRRADMIHITPPPLFQFLTSELILRGIDPRVFNLSELLLTGGPLTRSSAIKYEKDWGAAVSTTFSCTEIPGAAMQCPLDPSKYHPGLSMVVEIINRKTGNPVADGEDGELVLTGLYPFQSTMPMIRYRTGDMARSYQSICKCGASSIGFKLLGRSHHVIDLTDLASQEHFVGSLSFLESISDIEQIPTLPYPRFTIRRKSETSKPDTLYYAVEATSPHAFDAERVKSLVLKRLRRSEPILDNLVSKNLIALKLEICGKNSLDDYFKLYPGR